MSLLFMLLKSRNKLFLLTFVTILLAFNVQAVEQCASNPFVLQMGLVPIAPNPPDSNHSGNWCPPVACWPIYDYPPSPIYPLPNITGCWCPGDNTYKGGVIPSTSGTLKLGSLSFWNNYLQPVSVDGIFNVQSNGISHDFSLLDNSEAVSFGSVNAGNLTGVTATGYTTWNFFGDVVVQARMNGRIDLFSLCCGDGVVDPEEDCDDGNQIDGDECPTSCICDTPKISDIYQSSIEYDPIYVTQTISNRKFNPKTGKITPFDDINVKVEASKKCSTIIEEDEIAFNINLVAIDSLGNKEIIKEDQLNILSQNSTDIQLILKLKGWKDGWVSFNDMESLVKHIAKNDKIQFEITHDDNGNGVIDPNEIIVKTIDLSNCVHAWGANNVSNKLTTMRGESSYVLFFPAKQIETLESYRENGFFTVDPFKTYKNTLSFYADLKKYDDSAFVVGPDGRFNKATNINVPSLSTCGSSGKFIFYNSLTHSKDSAYTDYYAPTIFSEVSTPSIVPVHEMGHALCGLRDERLTAPFNLNGVSRANCVEKPNSEFKIGNFRFGAKKSFNYQPCEFKNLYRPTDTSIMNNPSEDNRFNVLGCGYCVWALKGQTGNPEDYYKFCYLSPMTLNREGSG